ncbi:hypothetical protein BOTBODRAFT_32569 [Botryobasidium botryosum FD-172 SS1]|uniref:Het-C-domain-containing protein n=1 Tax=Botryobasidium botryosum (strain FD-172 SS1) TaxID=930990 RepID=A0A067MF86_BOTB1|nr:hypothetical protein BOTBODRAFT_32569 [Botryobasidium botryosum FD-172 SS1]
MPSNSFANALLLVTTLLFFLPSAHAFGAGDIPDYSFLNEKAFRHGDIESILAELNKSLGANFSGGAAGLLMGVAGALRGGSKFSKMDIKRVYFGNWLRDYSQVMDIAGLSKLTADTLVTVVMALGFMAFGFATDEFEITADRLGVYLPVEHIDNPKGYAEKEGDARRYHPKLRPPVNRRELEIDPRTGMKNYIANEGQGWDTSSAHIRRVFEACIQRGRAAAGNEGADMWEAFRLLGTGLHTLEDLLAHSNWCELALKKMGHRDIFCHVGERVTIQTPSGPAPPLVTGTFGAADFLHSLLGEATDHLSEASVADFTKKMSDAKAQNPNDSPIAKFRDILSKLPSSSGNEQRVQSAEAVRKDAINFNPNNVAPEQVRQQLWTVLVWRDGMMKDIAKVIANIPGLEDLLEQLTNALNAYVFTILEPWLTPILQNATATLQQGSAAVIDSDDQYEVFNNPNASDPSHSLLSKDHFSLILNEPAGHIAQIVVKHSVNLIVKAWYDQSINPRQVIDQILEAFHHPYYARSDSKIQSAMFAHMESWINGLPSGARTQTLNALTKESVREGRNHREGMEGQDPHRAQKPGGYGGQQTQIGGPASYQQTQYGQSGQSGGYGYGQQKPPAHQQGGYGYQQSQSGGYGQQTQHGAGRTQYESEPRRDEGRYGRTQASEPPASGGYGSYGGYGSQTGASGGYGGSTATPGNYTGRHDRVDEPKYGRGSDGYSQPHHRSDERDESHRIHPPSSSGHSTTKPGSWREKQGAAAGGYGGSGGYDATRREEYGREPERTAYGGDAGRHNAPVRRSHEQEGIVYHGQVSTAAHEVPEKHSSHRQHRHDSGEVTYVGDISGRGDHRASREYRGVHDTGKRVDEIPSYETHTTRSGASFGESSYGGAESHYGQSGGTHHSSGGTFGLENMRIGSQGQGVIGAYQAEGYERRRDDGGHGRGSPAHSYGDSASRHHHHKEKEHKKGRKGHRSDSDSD